MNRLNRYPVEPTVGHDATAGFMALDGRPPDPEPRLVNLLIFPGENETFSIQVQSDSTFFPTGETWQASLPLDLSELSGAVAECERRWREAAVGYETEGGGFLLQDGWDLSGREADSHAILGQLAVAGAQLFDRLFTPGDDAKPADAKRLRRIAQALRDLTDRGSGWIRVTSDSYFAPWNLLYTKELDGLEPTNATLEGFWGFRHVVEQSPFNGVEPGVGVAPDLPVQLAAYLDAGIDDQFRVPCNAPVSEELARYSKDALAVAYRNDRPALETGWKVAPLRDQILYFCCHAEAASDGAGFRLADSAIKLTDGERITAGDISFLLREKTLDGRPIVFLNACMTARMNSPFYAGFAQTFLAKHASSVIGTTVEIPAVFAGEFARRFFTQLFAGGGGGEAPDEPRGRVGDILFRLRRTFVEDHGNPLGALYALYHGADVALPGRLPRES